MNKSVRAIATDIVAQVLYQGASLTRALKTIPSQLAAKDKALVQELAFGVCRYAHQLDGIAQSLLQKPIKNKETDIKALLLLGLYQLLHTRIPDHAAIGATVEVTKELKKPWATGLLNGVLRKVQRSIKSEQTLWPANDEISTSHPTWLLEKLKQAWPQHWQEIARVNNTQGPMTLRVNTQKTTVQDYLKRLLEQGIEAQTSMFAPHALLLSQPVRVEELPDFNKGFASVQDEAAQLSAHLLNAGAGQRVLDACAAPGGKTCHILESCSELETLIAVELEAERLRRVEENLDRLELTASLVCADAAEVSSWWDGQLFDRILLDAPCSATGVIRRHPDIKWLRRSTDIDKLTALQQRLLKALWATLKPGGFLVYATCSVLPEENEQNIAQFIESTQDAVHCPIDANWGMQRPYGRQLLPQEGGHDGFYYARIQKQK